MREQQENHQQTTEPCRERCTHIPARSMAGGQSARWTAVPKKNRRQIEFGALHVMPLIHRATVHRERKFGLKVVGLLKHNRYLHLIPPFLKAVVGHSKHSKHQLPQVAQPLQRLLGDLIHYHHHQQRKEAAGAPPPVDEGTQPPALTEEPAPPVCLEGQVLDEQTNLCVLEEPEVPEEEPGQSEPEGQDQSTEEGDDSQDGNDNNNN